MSRRTDSSSAGSAPDAAMTAVCSSQTTAVDGATRCSIPGAADPRRRAPPAARRSLASAICNRADLLFSSVPGTHRELPRVEL